MEKELKLLKIVLLMILNMERVNIPKREYMCQIDCHPGLEVCRTSKGFILQKKPGKKFSKKETQPKFFYIHSSLVNIGKNFLGGVTGNKVCVIGGGGGGGSFGRQTGAS